MQQLRDYFGNVGFALFLSIFGGVACAAKNKETSIWAYLSACIVAAFSGILTSMVLDEISLYITVSENVRNVAIGLAGFSGGTSLEIITQMFLDALRKVINKKTDYKDKK